MALGATVYKATIDVSDLDRDSYGNYVLTIARHPSETEERLMLRVLAFCRLAGERLEFGRGLSTEGEPALWEIDDTGAIVQWIEVGCPDVKQVRKAAGRSEHVQIVAYGEDRVEPWWEGNKGDFAKIGKLTVVSVPDDQVTALALMIRLFANMLGGHLITLVLISLIFIFAAMGPVIMGTSTVIAVVFAVFMGFIDLLICFIQAYVFMLLSAIFISLARPAETGTRHEK